MRAAAPREPIYWEGGYHGQQTLSQSVLASRHAGRRSPVWEGMVQATNLAARLVRDAAVAGKQTLSQRK